MPLGLAFASKSFDVTLVDINPKAIENINNARLPFKGEEADALLKAHVGKNLELSRKNSRRSLAQPILRFAPSASCKGRA